MACDALPRLDVLVNLHRLCWVDVLRLHEPARLVCEEEGRTMKPLSASWVSTAGLRRNRCGFMNQCGSSAGGGRNNTL